MKLTILFGSYREPSNGRRLLHYLVKKAPEYGFNVSVADAKASNLPILDKKFEEFDEGTAPQAMTELSQTLKESDAYLIISAEYNAAMPPGLVNLIDHFRSEYEQKPVGIATYSPGALGGARVSAQIRPFVANLGMVSIPSVLGVGAVHTALSETGEAQGEAAQQLEKTADGFLSQLKWYSQALKNQRNG